MNVKDKPEYAHRLDTNLLRNNVFVRPIGCHEQDAPRSYPLSGELIGPIEITLTDFGPKPNLSSSASFKLGNQFFFNGNVGTLNLSIIDGETQSYCLSPYRLTLSLEDAQAINAKFKAINECAKAYSFEYRENPDLAFERALYDHMQREKCDRMKFRSAASKPREKVLAAQSKEEAILPIMQLYRSEGSPGSLVVIYGPANNGKSIVTSEIVRSLSTGEPLFHNAEDERFKPSRAFKTLFIGYDDVGPNFDRNLVRVLDSSNDFASNEDNVFTISGKDIQSIPDLTDPNFETAMDELIEAQGIEVMLIDSLLAGCRNAMTESGLDISLTLRIMGKLSRIRTKHSIAIVLLHHANKQKNIFGSGHIVAEASGLYSLTSKDVGALKVKQLKCEKSRDPQVIENGTAIDVIFEDYDFDMENPLAKSKKLKVYLSPILVESKQETATIPKTQPKLSKLEMALARLNEDPSLAMLSREELAKALGVSKGTAVQAMKQFANKEKNEKE